MVDKCSVDCVSRHQAIVWNDVPAAVLAQALSCLTFQVRLLRCPLMNPAEHTPSLIAYIVCMVLCAEAAALPMPDVPCSGAVPGCTGVQKLVRHHLQRCSPCSQ